jgi:uncharacterized protein
MRSQQGLVATLYGPCEVDTEINGVRVKITEETDYPFNEEIVFTITVDHPVMFELALRKPSWADNFALEAPDLVKQPQQITSAHQDTVAHHRTTWWRMDGRFSRFFKL